MALIRCANKACTIFSYLDVYGSLCLSVVMDLMLLWGKKVKHLLCLVLTFRDFKVKNNNHIPLVAYCFFVSMAAKSAPSKNTPTCMPFSSGKKYKLSCREKERNEQNFTDGEDHGA